MSEAKMPPVDDRTADHLRDIYPSNSKMQPPATPSPSKPESPRHIDRVTKSETVEKKPSLGKRFLKTFVSEDIDDIKRYLKDDLIIPSIKTGILSALEMIFFHRTSGYGGWRPVDYSKPSQRPSTYSYSSRQQNKGYVYAGEPRAKNGSVKAIVYKTRMDAESVLRALDEEIAIYGEASVMHFYDASDIDSDFTDAKWGWKDISAARIYPVPGGFTIQMPRPIFFE